MQLNDYRFPKALTKPVGPQLKTQILDRSNYLCHYCQTEVDHDNVYMNHAVPTSRGGFTVFDNLRAACAICHLEKGSRTELEYLLWKFVKFRI